MDKISERWLGYRATSASKELRDRAELLRQLASRLDQEADIVENPGVDVAAVLLRVQGEVLQQTGLLHVTDLAKTAVEWTRVHEQIKAEEAADREEETRS